MAPCRALTRRWYEPRRTDRRGVPPPLKDEDGRPRLDEADEPLPPPSIRRSHSLSDESTERNQSSQSQINRDLQGNAPPAPPTPQSDHYESRDEGKFMKKIIKEQVDAGKKSHQPGLHEAEQGKVKLDPFGSRANGSQARGKTDYARHGEKRGRYPV